MNKKDTTVGKNFHLIVFCRTSRFAPNSSLLVPTIIQARVSVLLFILVIGFSFNLNLKFLVLNFPPTFTDITQPMKYVLYLILVKPTPTFPSTSDSS